MSTATAPSTAAGYAGDIDPIEAWRRVQAGEATLVDVRTAEEFEAGAIPGAVNIPIDAMRDRLDELAGPVLLYCEVGQRGHTAAALLHELDVEARNLDGGYQTWTAARRAAKAPIA